MADIFLSYASGNSVIAKRLSERLESIGWSVWWDREIPAGQTWRDVIAQSRASMRCMVVLWSKESIDSDWVKEEAEAGHALRKLVPVLIDDVKPPMGFRAIQAANLVGWDGSKEFLGFTNLIDALETHLGKPVESAADRSAAILEYNPPLHRQHGLPNRFDFSKLFQIANRLPWWSYATATVLSTMLIAASIGQQDRGPGKISPVSLPVKSLDAGEMQPSSPLTIRGPMHTPPAEAKSLELAPMPAKNNSQDLSLEKKPAKKIDSTRSKYTPIPSTTPIAYRCSEILARAQLGEPLSDTDWDALRKECPS